MNEKYLAINTLAILFKYRSVQNKNALQPPRDCSAF